MIILEVSGAEADDYKWTGESKVTGGGVEYNLTGKRGTIGNDNPFRKKLWSAFSYASLHFWNFYSGLLTILMSPPSQHSTSNILFRTTFLNTKRQPRIIRYWNLIHENTNTNQKKKGVQGKQNANIRGKKHTLFFLQVQTYSYNISKSWGCNVPHSDYS